MENIEELKKELKSELKNELKRELLGGFVYDICLFYKDHYLDWDNLKFTADDPELSEEIKGFLEDLFYSAEALVGHDILKFIKNRDGDEIEEVYFSNEFKEFTA